MQLYLQLSAGNCHDHDDSLNIILSITMMAGHLLLTLLVVGARGDTLLADGWVAALDASGLTARRHGRVALEALNVTFAVGSLSGGRNPAHRIAEPIGFSAVAFHAEAETALANATLDDSGVVRGRFCVVWTAAKCALLRAACPAAAHLRSAADSDGCVAGAVALTVADGTLTATATVGGANATAAPPPGVVGRLAFATYSPADEVLAGFGNMPSRLDVKNASFTVIAQENGLGRGDEPISALVNAGTATAGAAGNAYTTYSAIPAWLSSRGYAGDVVGPRVVTVDAAGETLALGVLGRVGGGGGGLFAAATSRSSPAPGNGGGATWAELQAAARSRSGPAPAFPAWPSSGITLGVMGGSSAVRAALASRGARGGRGVFFFFPRDAEAATRKKRDKGGFGERNALLLRQTRRPST